jgi:8-oxo-dGTP pyrophosphatase MutT (NUDIX family)
MTGADGPEEAEGDPRIPVGRVTGERTVPADAATVMLLRDGDDGLEVFMVERHLDTDFAGGALVFPGGKVDEGDRTLSPDRWTGLDVDALAEQMSAPAELTIGLHVAAVRETFEEAGLLLATREGGRLTAGDLERPTYTSARQRLAARESDWEWSGWLAREDLVLDLGALVWWSWWVTPHGVHRRYDTRFFVARAPGEQVGAHDAVETVSSRWIRPEAALRAGRDDTATLIYPTRKNLRSLAAYATVDAALDAARSGEVDRRRTVPEIVQGEEGIRIRDPHTGELDEP